MEYVIALPREPFDSLVGLEVLQANMALVIAQVPVSIQEDNGLDLSEVLIVIIPRLLKVGWQCLVVLS